MESIGLVFGVFPIIFHRRNPDDSRFFILCVLVLSLSTTFMYVTRFPVPFNTDAPKEYEAAYATRNSWDPALATSPSPSTETGYHGWKLVWFYDYIGCLSVTILPSMISNMLGTDTMSVFTYVYPLLVSLLPLVFFVVVRRFAGDSNATYLSAAITPAYLVFSGGFMQYYRSAVGIFMLYLLLFCLVDKARRITVPVILLTLGVVMSHYTVAYFGAIFLLIFTFSQKPKSIFRKIGLQWNAEKIVKPFTVGLFFVAMFLWGYYAERYMFADHFDKLWFNLSTGFNFLRTSPEIGYLVGNRRGPILTSWFVVELLSIGLGTLAGLYGILKGRTSGIKASWIICGSCAIAYVAAANLLLTSVNPILLEPTRVLVYVVPFAMLFLATLLLRARRTYGKCLAVVFVALMLPMNLMLPSNNYDLMFHTSSSLEPEMRSTWGTSFLLGTAYLEGANWIRQQIGVQDFIQVDSVSYGQMIFGTFPVGLMDRYRPPIQISRQASFESNMRYIRYLVVTDIFLEHGIWHQIYTNRSTIITAYDANGLLEDSISNLVYNDKAVALFYSNSE